MNQKKDIIKEDEIDLRELFRIFTKRKWWFVGTVLIILLIGFGYIFLKPLSYEVTYKIDVTEKYKNDALYNLYPNYAEELNFFDLQEVPAIFNSYEVFSSLTKISEDINPHKLITSDKVKISQVENTNLFKITVSNSDYVLAEKIGKTLIQSFKENIRGREKEILSGILDKINSDIKELEDRNINLKEEKILELESEIESLYEDLFRYIANYNINLINQLEEGKENSGSTFYNIIIPPNKISDKINTLNNEIQVYRREIIENEKNILALNNLYHDLTMDENLIIDRINLISEEPTYDIESNRLRNLAIVIVLSIIAGVIVVFIVNFVFSLKAGKDRL